MDFVPPAGYTVSPADQGGDDTVDSDANVTTGETANVTLAPGETNNTLDAGLYQPAALGDFVWSDTNANGIQDAGETGIAGWKLPGHCNAVSLPHHVRISVRQ